MNKKSRSKRQNKTYRSKKNRPLNNLLNSKPSRNKSQTQKVNKSKGSRKSLKGGFFLMPSYSGISSEIKKTVSSESNLINSYEKMTRSVNDYYNKYDDHIKNLISIDDFANFNSMEKLFKNEIVKKHFKNKTVIDKANPLLLRNYLAAGVQSPSAFRKEHLIKQIRYKLYYNFSDRDRNLIEDINVKIVDNESIVMIIRTIENNEYKRNIKHTNYTLDLASVNKELKTIIDKTKESLGYNILNENKSNSGSGLGSNLEVESNVDLNSNLIYKNKNDKYKNIINNNNSGSMMNLIDENSGSNNAKSGNEPINIFKELEEDKYKQEPPAYKKKENMRTQNQPTFGVPENLKEKLIIGSPTLGDIGQQPQTSLNQPQQQPFGQPQQPFGQPQQPQQQPFKMFNQGAEIKNDVEQRCRNITEQYQEYEDRKNACQIVPGCYFNYKKGICHKDMKS